MVSGCGIAVVIIRPVFVCVSGDIYIYIYELREKQTHNFALNITCEMANTNF